LSPALTEIAARATHSETKYLIFLPVLGLARSSLCASYPGHKFMVEQMATQLKSKLSTLLLAASFGFAALPAANATLVFAGSVNGTNVCAVDNDAFACGWGMQIPDTNPDVGFLGLGTTTTPLVVAGVEVFGSLHIAEILAGLNSLRSASLQIINTNPAAIDISVAVSANDFPGPSFEYSASGSGTWTTADGSTIDLEWYNDPGNALGASTPADRPGNLLAAAGDTATGATSSYSFDFPGGAGFLPLPAPDLGLYSMTVAFDINLAPGGRLTSRGQALVKPVGAIPEPGTLSLLAIALGLLGWRLRKTEI
jgi:hypothetical protein